MNSRVLLPLATALLLPASLAAAPKKEAPAEAKTRECWGGDFCEWWLDDPGEVYRNKKNPWISKVELSGRFHYQFGRVEGEDVRGNGFDNDFVEFRRARVSAEIDFLEYFEVEVGVNLVDDRRFRAGADERLNWGYDTFDAVVIGFDVGDALGKGPFDEIKLAYGRMKLNMSDEVHQSSNRLRAIERSALTELLGGDESRVTGLTLEIEKDDWTGVLGFFSNEDNSTMWADWDEGPFYYGSLEWSPNKRWTLRLDHAHADRQGRSDTLGYNHATSMAFIYESKRWGVTTDLIYGENSTEEERNPLREGDFYGGVLTPWVWLVKKRLQLVGRYQYARAENTEGFRLPNRYARALHQTPDVDLDSGYGDEHHSFYLGLNLHLCKDNAKIMAGVSYDTVSARTDDFSAATYLFAVRTFF